MRVLVQDWSPSARDLGGANVTEQTPADASGSAHAARALGFADRRSGRERRADEAPPNDEVAARRRLHDRRESPGGLIRNVLQVLIAIEHLEMPDGQLVPVDGIRRALWLALMEVERQESRAS